MAGQFQRKVALVTGGSSGIGQATAIAFAREGARVVLGADKDVEGGEETVKMIRKAAGEATFVKVDVSRAVDVEAMVSKSIELYGRLDFAFNNAGVHGSWASVIDCAEEVWKRTIAVNLTGAWLCMKYEISAMLKNGGGAIVNTASAAGLKALPGNSDYTASKFGLIGLTKAAALEYAKSGIRINAICPGIINTPMTQKTLLAPGGHSPPGGIEQAVPLGYMGTAEDIAKAAVWLCSEAASYITGLAMTVDGGLAV